MSQRLVDDELLRQAEELLSSLITYDWHNKPKEAIDKEGYECAEALRTALEQPAAEPCSGWSEAALAWEVCASIHASFAKGKDPFFKTRYNDCVGRAENARKNAFAAPQAQPVA